MTSGAEAYTERASSVPGAVAWAAPGRGAARILPDGCMDLIRIGDRLVVAGPDATAFVTSTGAPASTGLRLPPGLLPSVLRVPAHALTGVRVDLGDVLPQAEAEPLVEAAADQPISTLERFVRTRSAPSRSQSGQRPVGAIATALRAGRPVPVVADHVGYSERQLRRVCLDAFGYGPKWFSRIVRFRRALALVRRGVPAASAAVTCGYVDQAHLARDTRDLAGVTLTTLLGS